MAHAASYGRAIPDQQTEHKSLHLQNIYEEGELAPEATIKEYLTVQAEGNREISRQIDHYRLDAILAVGYRVRSHRGTQFRIWATERLREYLVKGFAMDDARLKLADGGSYFEELPPNWQVSRRGVFDSMENRRF